MKERAQYTEVFRHHLQQWRAAFEAGTSPIKPSELRELKDTNKALARELKRKEKALAEAAALLVLQKKYQALPRKRDARNVGVGKRVIGNRCRSCI